MEYATALHIVTDVSIFWLKWMAVLGPVLWTTKLLNL